MPYPKRLIEVDLPIKRISAHARREKSIRHGHISTLHIWWARRPLAACRAVICAALWPDPADELCPPAFQETAASEILAFARKAMITKSVMKSSSEESMGRWNAYARDGHPFDLDNPDHLSSLRHALLDFIADFANWDSSTNEHFLKTSRALTQAAHESLGGLPGTRPLVVDPFAGGGAIPLEALRVGADAFASDLNPVAVLLNKVVLEYIPKYGNADIRMQNAEGEEVVFQGLAEAVRYWGNWIKEQAETELAEFYPKDPDGATPIAYLWARTIISEAPDDGTGISMEVPLMRSLWLAKKKGRYKALRWVRDAKGRVQTETVEVTYADGVTRTVRRPMLEIFSPQQLSEVEDGTVSRGSATCPVTGYTTPVKSVRRQLKPRRGGADDARLFAVVTIRSNERGRFYRLPTKADWRAVRAATTELTRRKAAHTGPLSLVPDESTPMGGGSGAGRAFSQRNYGMDIFEKLFTMRQALSMVTFVRLNQEVGHRLACFDRSGASIAVQTCLALACDRLVDFNSSLSRWANHREGSAGTFGRQALPMLWDFGETSPISGSTGSFSGSYKLVASVLERQNTKINHTTSQATNASATNHPLPDDMAHCLFTDPPYYDAVPYADLSDFFVVWLKRTVGNVYVSLFPESLAPKEDECIVDEVKDKDKTYFEATMKQAMSEGRRVLAPSGVGIVVFAHKSTSGWEAQLQAMVDAGWVITGSWPIDTEMGSRLRAMDSAALASSIHLVCRPRENPDGSLRTGDVGDWRDVLQELPGRIHAWLPRLAQEGVVGADAIFACLGPALEIFSRYERVEKASGEVMTLGQYLEYVWAAVSKEALDMVFAGADTSGFEEDARLTAMWLWTLAAEPGGNVSGGKVVASTGYTLEYDAARKIAQGLGAYLERLGHLVEIKGSKARLLPVRERSKHLFGVEGVKQPARRKRDLQPSLFAQLAPEEAEAAGWQTEADLVAPPGKTLLDRVHQSMLLFAAGRSDALKRFLQDEGIGNDDRFWSLAQALSALYPTQTDEKRWVDGVLARKKGLGL